jgi:hypothetical protein
VKERAVLLGKSRSLIGVVTEPERPTPGLPAAILLNAGLVHRVGPNRINVQIARRLAAAGFCSLRFDLAGIGDSANRTDDLSLKDGIVSDAKEAMDYLAREEGVREFVVLGICSGANNSLRIALRDARVIGAVPIEPYHFSTPAYHFYYFSRRLFEPRCWRRALTLRSDFWGMLKNRFLRENLPKSNGRSGPLGESGRGAFKNQIVSEIEALLRRGVSLHFVYCTGSPSYYNHYLPLRGRMASWTPFRATLFENTDHIFTLLSSQQALVESVDDWMKTFAAAEKGSKFDEGITFDVRS